jgi:hypothetical protein
MKKQILFILILLVSVSVKAQWGQEDMDEKPSFKDRLFTGGGIGLSFTNYSDYFSISPLIGYRATNKLAVGLQFQYRYTNYKTISPSISTNDYGIAPFVRYYIYQPFFLNAEIEHLNYQFIKSATEKFRKNYNSFMAGGGFFQPAGRHAGFYALAMYNFSYMSSYNSFSPYNSPWVFRVGITAGF